MNGTVLFDLDGTLLVNPVDSFVEAYLSRIQEAFSAFANSNSIPRILMEGTHRMSMNRTPAKTLLQVFDEYFYPALQVEKDLMQAATNQFYEQEFPKLQPITAPRAEARELVEKLLLKGYQVAVATNPLFPLTAIEQRLAWAGLPVNVIPYQVVPSYETFHFTKPHPEYFAELLARMGWPEGPVIMIGDDYQLDIAPARMLGLAAFWTSEDPGKTITPGSAPADALLPTGSGSLVDAWNWLENVPTANIMPDFASKEATIVILRSTPAVISYFVENYPAINWYERPGKEEWAPVEILCHLRDVDTEVNIPRVKRILTENNPHLSGVDSDIWAAERNYLQQDAQYAFNSFMNARLELLELLEGLPEEAWNRTARHSILGKTDLAEIIRISASHDRLHVRQLHKNFPQTNNEAKLL